MMSFYLCAGAASDYLKVPYHHCVLWGMRMREIISVKGLHFLGQVTLSEDGDISKSTARPNKLV